MSYLFANFALPLIMAAALLVSACAHKPSASAQNSAQTNSQSSFAAKPLYVDPIYNGAADPTVIWDKAEQRWLMFYTNRRANVAGLDDVSWVHGTPIGIAESTDAGKNWVYRQDAKINYPPANQTPGITYWAPDVIAVDGVYHMYLTIVPGIFTNWEHPRTIAHFKSTNLLDWDYVATLKLSSNHVIDADVVALPSGGYRMFYNDEPDGKSIYYADSPDLFKWHDMGKAKVKTRGEGPVAFYWHDWWWLVVDEWRGLSVYRSADLLNWSQQPKRLLAQPGRGRDDGVIGSHADVVVNNGRAYLFYFTHPGRTPENSNLDNESTRRSVIQVTELIYSDGAIDCDRDVPTPINLQSH